MRRLYQCDALVLNLVFLYPCRVCNATSAQFAWPGSPEYLGLTGLTLAGVGLLAIGSVFLGMLVVGVCATTWWWVLPHLLDVPAVPTSHLRVSARLRQLSQVLRQAGPASSAQLTTTPSLFSIFSIHSPAIGTGGVLVGIGMLLGVLIGVLVARSFATVPAWALAAGAVGLIALAGAGAGVWQLAQSEQRAQAIRIVCWVAFVISLAVYAFTRFANIADFPIYFFSDEAVHTLQAQNLLRNGLSDSAGRFLPPYFANGVYWSLSLTVYVHALGQALFGHSIEIVRATSALFTLFGAAAIGLSTKLAFNQKWWWLGVLFLGATPAWFLHSRTAFETPLMASCYAGFLLFYLLYRARDPRFLLPAIACGALTFYAYTNGQGVMLVTGLLLLISDLRYHLRHKRIALMGLVMIAIVALPYARFRAEQPDAMANQLRILDSYWFLPISFGEKLGRFASEYLHGLSPFYWFLQNNRDLDRHVMKGYGHIAVWALPFWVAGLWVCIRNFKSAMHRVVLIALLAAPFGSAIAGSSRHPCAGFCHPIGLGVRIGCGVVDWVVARTTHARLRRCCRLGCVGLCNTMDVARCAAERPNVVHQLRPVQHAMGRAPIIRASRARHILRQNPDRRLVISPTWTNGTDTVMRFFELDPKDTQRVQLLNIDYYLQRKQVMDSSTTFVMLADEVDRADKSGKFSPILVEKIIACTRW